MAFRYPKSRATERTTEAVFVTILTLILIGWLVFSYWLMGT